MPRSQGVYSLPTGNPIEGGSVANSTTMNATLTDIGNEITASVARNGTSAATANLPMGNFRHTAVGNASARNQYASAAQVQDGALTALINVAGTNTITADCSPAISAYADNMSLVFVPAESNTGTATLAINGLSAIDLLKDDGAELQAGDLVAGIPAYIIYYDTAFYLLNPSRYDDFEVYAVRYGAPVDGVTSANSGISAADTVAQAEGSAIVFSPGIYLVDSNLTIESDFDPQPGSMFRVANGVTLKLLGWFPPVTHKLFDLVGTGSVMFGSAANQWPNVRSIARPDNWGATGPNGSGNDTTAVQKGIDSHRPTIFQQSYPVTQVKITGNEHFLQWNGQELLGIGGSALKSVLDINGGYGTLEDIKVSAQFDPDYETAVHWYTNDLTDANRYPGFNRIDKLWARNALIGVCIGALPSQADPIPAQNTVQAEGVATDAPLSETYIIGLQVYDCVFGLYVRQPNGKVTLIAPNINANPSAWSDYGSSGYTAASSCALVVKGSELFCSGGSLENVTEPTGTLMQITDSTVNLVGMTIESVCRSFISGASHVAIAQTLNFGFNMTSNYPLFEIKNDAVGFLNLTDQRVLSPPGDFSNGTVPAFKAVSGLAGSFSPNLGHFRINASGVEFRDQPFIGTTTYVPLADGVEIHFGNCTATKYDGSNNRLVCLELDDGPDILGGHVDVSHYTITAYGANGNASSGGWTFAVSNVGTCNWGSRASGITHAYKTLDKSLAIQAPSGQSTTATSPKIAIHPEKTYLIRGYFNTGTSGATAKISAKFYKWDNSAASTASADFINVPENQIGSEPRQLLGHVTAPKDAVKLEVVLYVENGAAMDLTDESVK